MRRFLKRGLGLFLVVAVLAGVVYGAWCGYRRWAPAGGAPLHSIRRVEARVEAGEESATVRLTVEITGPGLMKSARVAVLPTGVSLIEARVDGEEAEMDLLDGRPALIVSGAGDRTAELVYALPLSGERGLVLALPRGISTGVELALPKPALSVRVPPPGIVRMLPAEKGTLARIVTPPTDCLEITWFPRSTEVVTAARTGARTETLYTIQGDSLAGRTVYSLRVDGPDVARVTFALPDGVMIDQVDGGWVKGWNVENGELLVQARAPLSGEAQLTVHHRRALGEAQVELAVPALRDAVRQWGFGAVATGGAVEIRSLEVTSGAEIDPRGLPEALRSAGAAPVARAFRYDSVPSSQKLALVRHVEIETLEATCDVLNALLTYTPDGRCMGKAVYTVRNARRQHLVVALPAGARLWSAYVAGKPVRPAETGEGKLLVPLSCSAATASRGFAVELIYYTTGEAFAEKGKFTAALPVVEIPVMGVMLSVSVPEDINLEDFSGGLRQVQAFAFALDPRDDRVLREEGARNPKDQVTADLNKQLEEQAVANPQGNRRLRIGFQELVANSCAQRVLRFNNDNRNFVRQFYLENGPAVGQPTAAAAEEPAQLNLTGFGQEELAEITGLASLSIAVPSGGQVYRFERQLLFGETAEIRADYWSALAAQARPDAELRLSSKSASVYSLSGQGLKLTSELEYRVGSGKAESVEYSLPAALRVISVSGANVAEWKCQGGRLSVKLVRPERRGGRLALAAELPPLDGAEVEMLPPRLVSARTEDVVLGVSAPQNFELVFPEPGRLEPLTPAVLPAALRNGGHTSVFRLSARDGSGLRLRAVQRSGVAALRATCDSVNAISFYTEEGVGVTRAIFEIRNSGRRHLEVRLPEGARLWGAFVADRAVKPLAGEEGGLLLPLDLPAGGAVSSYPVEVVYVQPGKPFERRGEFAAELPEVDVPVMHAMYSLYVPRRMRLGRPVGTLKSVREFAGPVTPPASSIVRPGAIPPADVAALAGNARYQDRQMALELNVSQQKLQQALRLRADQNLHVRTPAGGNGGAAHPEGDGAGTSLAACGVKVYIPAVGRLLRFERHLVVDGEMSLSCQYRM